MIAESSLHLAIQELGNQEQVPLVADHLPPDSQQSIDSADSTNRGDLYVRIGVPLAVEVEATQRGVLVRGNLEKMNWAPFEAISRGLRKLIAASLNVEVEVLDMNKLLVVDRGHATQYVEIVVPSGHSTKFTSADTQARVETFSRIVMGEPPRNDTPQDDGQLLSIDLGLEVRAAAGGLTLPAACTISSPSWSTSMQIAGKLGDKPRAPPSEPEELVIDCRVDGYIKSQRVVHLLPVSTDNGGRAGVKRDGRKIIAFDEDRWFDHIAALAPKRRQVVRATYQRVIDGKKELLQLVDLETVPSPCEDAAR